MLLIAREASDRPFTVHACTFPATSARGSSSWEAVLRSWSGRPRVRNRGALSHEDGVTIAEAARTALDRRLPLVLVVSSSGADVTEGIAAMHGWGMAAAGIARCSGIVPVLAAVTGPAISGPALMLGLADVVAMTPEAFAFVSGPDMVLEFTGIRIERSELGGTVMHATSSGLCARSAPPTPIMRWRFWPMSRRTCPLTQTNPLPSSIRTIRLTARRPSSQGSCRQSRPPLTTFARWPSRSSTTESSSSFEPPGRPSWSPRSGRSPASRWVCSRTSRGRSPERSTSPRHRKERGSFGCATRSISRLITLVDTPGFLPGKDLEWRGMIRHGAELAFAYAEATVPRICLILRKAYGGAYIVLDSKGIGNDICLAWPSAEVAVMGSRGAVQILHRRADASELQKLESDYSDRYLTPWVAAERGFVDIVIEPAETRSVINKALALLSSRREQLRSRRHDNGPL